jgi:hypothetical protein
LIECCPEKGRYSMMARRFLVSVAVVLWLAGTAASQQVQCVVESRNFRGTYTDRDYAERAVNLAERYRTQVCRRWFGRTWDWDQKCDIYFSVGVADLQQRTGSPNVPGLAEAEWDRGGVKARRLRLRIDYSEVWTNVLPHEVSHAVFSDQFGTSLPKWLDEGMAGQSETPEQHGRLRRHVLSVRDNLWGVRYLMTSREYPRNYVSQFYAETISLVRYLLSQGGESRFVEFARATVKDGPELAVRKYYERTYAEIQRDWLDWLDKEAKE